MKRFSILISILLLHSLLITTIFLGAIQAYALPRSSSTQIKILEQSGKIHQPLLKIFGKKYPTERVPVIIRFKNKPTENDLGRIEQHEKIEKRFQRFFNGASVSLSAEQLENIIENDAVYEVYEDFEVSALLDTSTELINIPDIKQSYGATGNGIRVAILDTGISDSHPALQGRVIASKDFTTEGTTEDLNGHGTHVACIIGCNDTTYQGVAPSALLLNAKVMQSNGSGNVSDILEALEWSVENGAKVINMSLGAEYDSCDGSDILSQMIDEAVGSGVTVVVAAGNSGPSSETVNVPGCSKKSLTVGAVTESGGSVASFSSYGPTSDGRIKPDILAPGVNITAAKSSGGWVTYSGTSMATPHIAGVVALLLEKDSALDPENIREILTETADKISASDEEQGYGLVDPLEALGKITGQPVAETVQTDSSTESEAVAASSSENSAAGSSTSEDGSKKIREGKLILKTCLAFSKSNPVRQRQCRYQFLKHRKRIMRLFPEKALVR